MKKQISLLVACLAIHVPSVLAKDYFVAISPFEAPETVRIQAEQVLAWAIALEGGDRVTILDGFNLNTLGRFEVPESASYASPRARLNANKEAVSKLLQFASQAAKPSGDYQPSISGAILLPQLLRQVAMLPSDSDLHEVIVMASPIYDHPAQPEWSMVGSRFPTDINIFNSRSESPYAAADTPELLKGFRVHIAFDETEGDMDVDSYAFRVQRYFTLFIEAQGGELVSFTNNAETALERAKLNSAAVPHQFEVAQVALEDQSIYERPIARDTLSRDEIRWAGNVSIGLTWDCASCDLDLYARHSKNSSVLYYDNPAAREGRIQKEFPISFQDSGNRGFETVYYTVATDLNELAIGVNFYEGSAPNGIQAELRIDIDGKTFAKTVLIQATQGNHGAGVLTDLRRGVSSSPQTVMINPLDVINHD